jgi:hypothetical protein
MTNDKELERQKDLQRITNAYHRTFNSEDGKELAKLSAYKDNEGQVMQLNQDEQIIGIYGNKN